VKKEEPASIRRGTSDQKAELAQGRENSEGPVKSASSRGGNRYGDHMGQGGGRKENIERNRVVFA